MSEKADEVRAEIVSVAIAKLKRWCDEEPTPGPMSRDNVTSIGVLMAAAFEVRQVQAERDSAVMSLNARIKGLEEILDETLQRIAELKNALGATNSFLASFHAFDAGSVESNRLRLHQNNTAILKKED